MDQVVAGGRKPVLLGALDKLNAGEPLLAPRIIEPEFAL